MSGYRFGAGLLGTKTLLVGKDASSYLYTDLQSAFDAAQANDVVVVHPGTYTATAQLTLTKPLKVVGVGQPLITCGTLTTSMIDIELAAQAAASEVYFEGLNFKQGTDNKDVFSVDNTSVGYALTLTFRNCKVQSYDSASTGKALTVSHSSATEAVILNVGSDSKHEIGCVSFAAANAGDAITYSGVSAVEDGSASAVITGTGAVAADLRFYGVSFKTALKALTGGNAAQTVRAYNCSTESTGAALVTGDLPGSQTETVISP